MEQVLFHLITGLVLGLTAGITPGPLLALVVSQTVNYGAKEGAKVAVAPLISDLPIILIAFLIVWRLSAYHWIPGTLAIVGAGYISYLGWESLWLPRRQNAAKPGDAKSVQRGALVNLLNPHPYFFWLTVGISFLTKTWSTAPGAAVLWVSGFYVALVGSKLAMAALVGRARSFLDSRLYRWVNRCIGLVLFLFAALLLKNGLQWIGLDRWIAGSF